ncbi:hypothetical protein J3458_022179 [Metarhizium acridum]|uniref:uncharacterized protein n=1 Tax=Metarhizium acridum TaxID=92637 RepID=UPI001C6CD12E|nr:hypothetical protein J3458_022179 [Metarhizium acridum]
MRRKAHNLEPDEDRTPPKGRGYRNPDVSRLGFGKRECDAGELDDIGQRPVVVLHQVSEHGSQAKGARPWVKVMVDTAITLEASHGRDQLSGSWGLWLGCGTRTR